MQIIKDKISIQELKQMSEKMFGDFVKAVVDIEKEIIAVDAQMHADLEKLMLENKAEQKNLWGINLYPEFFNQENFIEFDSMINLRPWQNNRSRGVDDPEIKEKIIRIVNGLVEK
ncbi:MAG: DUF5674 family protein [Candidatus Kuenenbacteria bacterium]